MEHIPPLATRPQLVQLRPLTQLGEHSIPHLSNAPSSQESAVVNLPTMSNSQVQDGKAPTGPRSGP